MNNDIKEILDTLGNKECYINDEMLIYFDDAKTLLDYITNLQKRFNALLETHKICDELEQEQDKEIARLNIIIDIKTNRIQQLMKRLSKRQEKVDRLNNIINELERILFSNKMYGEKVFEKSGLSVEGFKQQHPYTLGSYDNSVNLLDKIKELKEGK